MRKKTEAHIDVVKLRNGFPVTEDFNTEFCKFIIDHYLCEFKCFYLRPTHDLTTLFAYTSPLR